MKQKTKKSETRFVHDWRKKSIYQIYPRSFHAQENKDGNGDLKGIIDKLDYLQELGVDVIYLSPIYPSPMKDNGYDVADYLDINPMFGDQQTFDQLIANVHERNMQLMMDFVPNHTSDQHEWFKESRTSKDNPKRNWYHWRSEPNNWINMFDNTSGSAWTYDEKTKEYYLHSFLKEQPDLNWNNPDVVNAMYSILTFWMDRGIDAFRIDVGLYVIKHSKYPDEPLNPDYIEGKSHPNEIYIHTASKDQPLGFKKLADMGNLVGSRGKFSMHEVYVGAQERVMLYRLSEHGLSVPLDFDLISHTGWNAKEVKNAIFDYYALLKNEDIVPLPLGNHDQSRVATRLGSQEDARLAAMLQMTLDCVPVIFQGEEIGMEDVQIPLEKQQDPFVDRLRDPARTPMQWDDSPNAGFTEAGAKPWLPIGPHYKERNVKKQLENLQSMLSLYKKLLALRKKSLISGRPVAIDVGNENVLSYIRIIEDDKQLLILLNFSNKPESIDIKSLSVDSGKLLLTTSLERKNEEVIDFKNFVLKPKEGYICLL
ncbi:MAG TPA: alpha-amylase family glycosyl hydrolase [Candidatus Acidoferrales bacterium]|nr:alpha-amylase family glycosyl hydrolase [Candidatus Acidoferrales bacterium]